MDDLLVPLPVLADKPDVIQTDVPILQSLGEAQFDLLPRPTLNRQAAHPRVVLPEIVNKAVPARENSHGLDLPLYRNGGHIRHP